MTESSKIITCFIVTATLLIAMFVAGCASPTPVVTPMPVTMPIATIQPGTTALPTPSQGGDAGGDADNRARRTADDGAHPRTDTSPCHRADCYGHSSNSYSHTDAGADTYPGPYGHTKAHDNAHPHSSRKPPRDLRYERS